MKKFFKTIVFQIGVDVLGFPVFHKHQIENRSLVSDSVYFKAYSKK
ncbi:hypothetical protein [Elizabethkingia miricola]|nr:hypothetical protein [Elizabethkingia miricola]MCT4181635.1 hypothetical protein [Elizabethkingia anophelis]